MILSILIVDDDEKIRENLKKGFDRQNISNHTILVETAETFENAVEKINSVDYDIVILDLFKDKHNDSVTDETAGVKVLEQIRRIVFVPVIFYTGHAHKINDLISEVVGVVSKGDGIEALSNEIERIINSKLALLKKNVYKHVAEQLRNFFWEAVDSDKKVFDLRRSDYSLGYLLLRRVAHSLSKENIKELLGDENIKSDKAHPMEFYIYPTRPGEYETGELVAKDGILYAILTPSCDFVAEGARARKVGQVLLAVATRLTETEPYKKYINNKEKYKQALADLIESRKGDRYFFLPGTPFIENLVLDFQNKISISYDDMKAFTRVAKLDTPYSESMISSFIRYYNRIGSPDIDSEYIISKL